MSSFIGYQDINLLSIKGSFFWHYRQYSKGQEYANDEDYARNNKPGFGNWLIL
jgi:endonuclease YncB( thermonuclease family)